MAKKTKSNMERLKEITQEFPEGIPVEHPDLLSVRQELAKVLARVAELEALLQRLTTPVDSLPGQFPSPAD
jgi:hypothetical protein